MNTTAATAAIDAALEHVAAFNAHDQQRLLAGLHPNIVWSTGIDTLRGHAAMTELFDDGLWAMDPSLRVVAGTTVVAAELQESLTIDGEIQTFPIACFFDLAGPSIVRVKVFREGTADVA